MSKQEKLIKRDPKQIDQMKLDLAAATQRYIRLEDEKRAADQEFNDELNGIWKEIRDLDATLRDEE